MQNKSTDSPSIDFGQKKNLNFNSHQMSGAFFFSSIFFYLSFSLASSFVLFCVKKIIKNFAWDLSSMFDHTHAHTCAQVVSFKSFTWVNTIKCDVIMDSSSSGSNAIVQGTVSGASITSSENAKRENQKSMRHQLTIVFFFRVCFSIQFYFVL